MFPALTEIVICPPSPSSPLFSLIIRLLFVYFWLCAGVLRLRRAGAAFCCGGRASPCIGSSCRGAQALGAQASGVVAWGPRCSVWRVESSWTSDRTTALAGGHPSTVPTGESPFLPFLMATLVLFMVAIYPAKRLHFPSCCHPSVYLKVISETSTCKMLSQDSQEHSSEVPAKLVCSLLYPLPAFLYFLSRTWTGAVVLDTRWPWEWKSGLKLFNDMEPPLHLWMGFLCLYMTRRKSFSFSQVMAVWVFCLYVVETSPDKQKGATVGLTRICLT